jgi:tetratricopeptide (TPR) repeat protein
VLYLEKTFMPHNLAVYYTFPGQLPIWQVLVSTLFVLIISVAVFAAAKRWPYLLVGWLWYMITLLPVIKIVEGVYDAMADRYHYLPSVGIAVGLAWGIPLLFKHEETRKKILFPTGIAFISILAVLAWQQCRYWENSKALFTHALRAKNNNYMVHNCLGIVLFDEGKTQEAIDNYNDAIRLKPDNSDAYFNKGNVYAKRGDYQRAFENYNEAIRLKPDNAAAFNNRGKILENLSEYERAIGDYNEAIRLKPDNILAYYNRGNVYDKLGRYQLAIENYNEAIRLKPDNAAAYCNKGMTYAKIGLYQHAIEDFNDAIRLEQDYADAYNGRGIVYLLQGNKEPGCRDAQKACELGNCKALELAKGREDCL